jgi:hypothetical protein
MLKKLKHTFLYSYIYGSSGCTNIRIFVWKHFYMHHCKIGHDTRKAEKDCAVHTPHQ